jgi:hypothetical protein
MDVGGLEYKAPKLSHFPVSFHYIGEHQITCMRALIYVLLLFTTTIYAQQTSPYAEFYTLGDSMRVLDKLRTSSAGVQVKIFTAAGKELNARIKLAEVSFVQKATVVRTVTIQDQNEIILTEFRINASRGDKIIIKIQQVENLDRKAPIYLSKTVFSFTLE